MWVEVNSVQPAFMFKYLVECVQWTSVRAISSISRLDYESRANEVQGRQNDSSQDLRSDRDE